MNVLGFAEVRDDGLPGIGQLQGHRLRLLKFRPGTVHRLGLLSLKISELDPEEREIALAPFLAPLGDHQREEFAIVVGPPGIALTLIPDRALHGVADDRVEIAVVEVAGAGIAFHLFHGTLRSPSSGTGIPPFFEGFEPSFRGGLEVLSRVDQSSR